jgi:carbonic anhydrase
VQRTSKKAVCRRLSKLPKKLKTYPAVVDPEVKAIVIYCVDPRFPIAFRRFVPEELGLKEGQFIPITIAGGPAALAHPHDMFNRCRMMLRQMGFSYDHFEKINRIILISHEDCGYYSVVPKNGGNQNNREKNDIPQAIFQVSLTSPEKAKIEGYYAFFVDKKRTLISFEKVI